MATRRGEYTTIYDIRTSYLSITSTGDDALLLDLLRSVCRDIDKAAGWFFYPCIETRYFDARTDAYGRGLTLDLPLLAVTTLTNGDAVAVTTDQYVFQPRNTNAYPKWKIELLRNSGITWTYEDDPEDAITVNGYWAYSKTVPADIRRAAAIAVAHLYRAGGTNSDNDRPLVADGVVIEPGRLPASFWAVVRAPNYTAFT